MNDASSSPLKTESNIFPQSAYGSSAPKPYRSAAFGMPAERPPPRWHPRTWGRKTIIGVVIGIVILIMVIIVAAVLGTRANRYPDYNRLNYQLKDNYSGVNFFDQFDYFTGYDPSQGFVHYVDQAGSQQMNLTYATAVSAVLKVDTSETNAITGRKSVRITSKNQYNGGLFIFDVAHTPYGCGTW